MSLQRRRASVAVSHRASADHAHFSPRPPPPATAHEAPEGQLPAKVDPRFSRRSRPQRATTALPLLAASRFQARSQISRLVSPVARLATKLQRGHYTELKHDAIFELRCRCLIASCCYRLAPSKYSRGVLKTRAVRVSGYGKITRGDSLLEREREREREREKSPSPLRDLWRHLRSLGPFSVGASGERVPRTRREESMSRSLFTFCHVELPRHGDIRFGHGS